MGSAPVLAKAATMFNATVLCDSLSSYNGSRLISLELTYPRCIHSEMMTHRVFSRNAASSRAIPVRKLLDQIKNNPFIPFVWGRNEPGMQATKFLEGAEAESAKALWLEARDNAVASAEKLVELGLHKQVVNRILEPFSWITIVLSGTQFSNFEAQRCHEDAEPHMQKIAYLARDVIAKSSPTTLNPGEYHLPYVAGYQSDYDTETQIKVSVARCARVSYLNHGGVTDVGVDLDLYNRMLTSGHWSPFEHVATPTAHPRGLNGNFDIGWEQFRKTFKGECR